MCSIGVTKMDRAISELLVARAERDELLAALMELLAAMNDNDDDDDNYSRFTKAEEKAAELVAKYK